MKTNRNSITGFLLLLILFGVSSISKADTWESIKKKEINQSFSISKNGLLHVDNKFGEIAITHWNKSEVSIVVKIESSASNDQVAQENLDRIKVDISKNGDKVSAVTTIGESRQSGSRNQQFKINYHISIPSTMKLELNQRYGNINLPAKTEGESNLVVKYGNLRGGSFTKALNIEAAYSNVNIQDVVNATMDFAYCGEAKIGNSKQLTIDSKYSNLNLDDSDALNVEIKYGNMNANKAQNVSLEIKYSNATIESISEELLIESLDYSTLNINELSSNFKRVNAAARYGTLNINIASKAAFTIDATRVGNNLTLQGLKETKHDIENKSDHFVEINGGGSGKINFEGNKYSNLKIRAR